MNLDGVNFHLYKSWFDKIRIWLFANRQNDSLSAIQVNSAQGEGGGMLNFWSALFEHWTIGYIRFIWQQHIMLRMSLYKQNMFCIFQETTFSVLFALCFYVVFSLLKEHCQVRPQLCICYFRTTVICEPQYMQTLCKRTLTYTRKVHILGSGSVLLILNMFPLFCLWRGGEDRPEHRIDITTELRSTMIMSS